MDGCPTPDLGHVPIGLSQDEMNFADFYMKKF